LPVFHPGATSSRISTNHPYDARCILIASICHIYSIRVVHFYCPDLTSSALRFPGVILPGIQSCGCAISTSAFIFLTNRVRAFTYARSPKPRETVDTLGGEMVSEFECYQWLVECQNLQGFEILTSQAVPVDLTIYVVIYIIMSHSELCGLLTAVSCCISEPLRMKTTKWQ